MEVHHLIHIPKTGGTAAYLFLNKNWPSVFTEYAYPNQPPHELKAKAVANPIVILRDPIDRAISSYNYWRGGSEMFATTEKNMPFLEFLENITVFNVFSSYMWPDHLMPQFYWLTPEDYSKTIVILYEENLNSKMRALIECLGLDLPSEEIPRINVTNKRELVVSEEEKNIIRERYQLDFMLWHDANNNKQWFKKVI